MAKTHLLVVGQLSQGVHSLGFYALRAFPRLFLLLCGHHLEDWWEAQDNWCYEVLTRFK